MTIYFSPSTKGFFDTAFHGERRIEVVDEVAAEQAHGVALAQDRAEHEAACVGLAEEDQPLAGEFRRHRYAVRAQPPMMTIDNPACTVPADAIDISAERHAELLAAQAEGQIIKTGTHGLPIAAEREADPEAAMASIRAARNAALKASDWTQLADAELSAAKKKAWAAHRKHLRDLPRLVAAAIAEGRDPAEIELPVPPG